MGLTEIDVVEPSATRRKSIEALGARTLDPSSHDVPALIAERTDGNGVDAAFDAAGVEPAIDRRSPVSARRRPLISVAIYDKPLTDAADQPRPARAPHPGHDLLHGDDYRAVIDLMARGTTTRPGGSTPSRSAASSSRASRSCGRAAG